MRDRRDTAAGVAAVFTASFAFSWGFVLVKAIALPPATIAVFRLLIGAVVLGVASAILKPGWPNARPAVLHAVRRAPAAPGLAGQPPHDR
jgi:hypothetical protein